MLLSLFVLSVFCHVFFSIFIVLFSSLSSASKCHFQSVVFRLGISRAPGSSLGTSPCTRAKVTLVHRSHTQQNKGKQVSFFWKAPRNAPGGNRIPFLLCKGSAPGTRQKMTPRKWHLDSLDFKPQLCSIVSVFVASIIIYQICLFSDFFLKPVAQQSKALTSTTTTLIMETTQQYNRVVNSHQMGVENENNNMNNHPKQRNMLTKWNQTQTKR